MRLSSPKARSPDQSKVIVISLLLSLVTFFLYWPVRHFAFNNYDDAQYITQNYHVQNGLNAADARWAFTTGYAGNWHPLTWLSHQFDFQFFALHAGGHHLVNVVFHTINTLLLFWLLRRWTGSLWGSAFVAALFAWHPLHVESVAWVAERKDVLSACFWLLTLFAYGRYVSERSATVPFAANRSVRSVKFWYGLTLVLFALGLMAKPMLVSLPLVLLLLDYWPLARLTFPLNPRMLRPLLVEKIPFFLLTLVSCLITFAVQKQGQAVQSLNNLSLHDRIANATVAYVRYLGKLFWPADLSLLYPYVRHLPLWEVLGAAILLLVITTVAIRSAKSNPPLLVGWLWFLITLVPVIGLVQVGEQSMADRYTYIPSIGLFIAVVWGVIGSLDFIPNFTLRSTVVAASAIILIAAAVATARQLPYWKNSVTLFSRALQIAPNNPIAENNLGLAYAEMGQTNAAILHEQKAIQLNPHYPEAENNLGLLLAAQGRVPAAISDFQAAIHSKPDYANAFANLGVIYAGQGHLAQAISNYQKAIELAPNNAYAHNALGRALEAEDRFTDATAHYSAATKFKPDFAEAHGNLGVMLALQGSFAAAESQFLQALKLQPNSASLHYDFGNALLRQNKWSQAATQYQSALNSQPDYFEAHFNLAFAWDQLGNTAGAIQHYRAALKLNPQAVPALQKLAWLLATSADAQFRDADAARSLAAQSVKLAPEDAVSWDVQAAALAEAGQIPEAVASAEKALTLAKIYRKELTPLIEQRLKLYQAGLPFREAPHRP